MPQAIGASLGTGRQSIALCGDGGFTMLMGELLTAAELDLPVKLMIFNNSTRGIVRAEMEVAGYVPWGTDVKNPNFGAVAQAVGIHGERVETPGDIQPAIQPALEHIHRCTSPSFATRFPSMLGRHIARTLVFQILHMGFIPTLDHPGMVGVNPAVAHEPMAGLNFMHGVAQAWAGKLFHIDLNDQAPGRYDQDLRFGSANPKSAFWLVKFLEDVGYAGPRHFDAHAYRTEGYGGVKDFARGCMRTYLIILKEKAGRWNDHKEIKEILQEISTRSEGTPELGRYSQKSATALLAHVFDKDTILKRRLPYERLDQLTIDILTGAR